MTDFSQEMREHIAFPCRFAGRDVERRTLRYFRDSTASHFQVTSNYQRTQKWPLWWIHLRSILLILIPVLQTSAIASDPPRRGGGESGGKEENTGGEGREEKKEEETEIF